MRTCGIPAAVPVSTINLNPKPQILKPSHLKFRPHIFKSDPKLFNIAGGGASIREP